MSAGVHPIVPAVSTINTAEERQNIPRYHSPTKSTAGELNPDAPSFQPNHAHLTIHPIMRSVPHSRLPHLNHLTEDAAENICDTRSNKVAEVQSSSPPLKNGLVQEGVHFSLANNIFVMTCDTLTMPEFGQSKKVAANIVATQGMPGSIQLNILTGPRLPLIHRVQEWFNETLGPFTHASYQIQIVIIRCGEKIGAKWTMTDLDLENFHPLTNFVAEITQILPAQVQILWGATLLHELELREYYHSKAAPAVLTAFESHEDKGVRAFSEPIDSRILNKIYQQYAHLKGRKSSQQVFPAPNHPANPMSQIYGAHPAGQSIQSTTVTSTSAVYHASHKTSMYGSSGTSSRCGAFDPNAAPFKPQCIPIWRASQQISPLKHNEPFHQQLIEVEASRGSDWVPPIWDFGSDFDQPSASQSYCDKPAHSTRQTSLSFYPQMNDQRSPQSPQMPLEQRSDNRMNIEIPIHSMYPVITSQPNHETEQRPCHNSETPSRLHAPNEQQSQGYGKQSKKKFNNRGRGGPKHPDGHGAFNCYDQGMDTQFNGYGENGQRTMSWNQQGYYNGFYQGNSHTFKENTYSFPNLGQYGEGVTNYASDLHNFNGNNYRVNSWNQNGHNNYNYSGQGKGNGNGGGGKKKNKKNKKKAAWGKHSPASEPPPKNTYFSEYTAADHIAATAATASAPSQTGIPAVSLPTGMLSLQTQHGSRPASINTAVKNFSGSTSSAPRSPPTIDGFGSLPTPQNMGWSESFPTLSKDTSNQTPTTDSWTHVSLLPDTPVLLDTPSPTLTLAQHDIYGPSATFKNSGNGYGNHDQPTNISHGATAASGTQPEDCRFEQEAQPNIM